MNSSAHKMGWTVRITIWSQFSFPLPQQWQTENKILLSKVNNVRIQVNRDALPFRYKEKMYFPFKNILGGGIKPTRKQEACYNSEPNEQVSMTGIWNSGSCSMVHMSGPGAWLVLQGWFGGCPPHPDHAGRELPQRAPPLWCPHCSTS